MKIAFGPGLGPDAAASGYLMAPIRFQSGDAFVDTDDSMVVISATQLMDEMAASVLRKSFRTYSFSLIDSPRFVLFKRVAPGLISLAYGPLESAPVEDWELAQALLDGATEFRSRIVEHLPQGDPARLGFLSALEEFEELFGH